MIHEIDKSCFADMIVTHCTCGESTSYNYSTASKKTDTFAYYCVKCERKNIVKFVDTPSVLTVLRGGTTRVVLAVPPYKRPIKEDYRTDKGTISFDYITRLGRYADYLEEVIKELI